MRNKSSYDDDDGLKLIIHDRNCLKCKSNNIIYQNRYRTTKEYNNGDSKMKKTYRYMQEKQTPILSIYNSDYMPKEIQWYTIPAKKKKRNENKTNLVNKNGKRSKPSVSIVLTARNNLRSQFDLLKNHSLTSRHNAMDNKLNKRRVCKKIKELHVGTFKTSITDKFVKNLVKPFSLSNYKNKMKHSAPVPIVSPYFKNKINNMNIKYDKFNKEFMDNKPITPFINLKKYDHKIPYKNFYFKKDLKKKQTYGAFTNNQNGFTSKMHNSNNSFLFPRKSSFSTGNFYYVNNMQSKSFSNKYHRITIQNLEPTIGT